VLTSFIFFECPFESTENIKAKNAKNLQPCSYHKVPHLHMPYHTPRLPHLSKSHQLPLPAVVLSGRAVTMIDPIPLPPRASILRRAPCPNHHLPILELVISHPPDPSRMLIFPVFLRENPQIPSRTSTYRNIYWTYQSKFVCPQHDTGSTAQRAGSRQLRGPAQVRMFFSGSRLNSHRRIVHL